MYLTRGTITQVENILVPSARGWSDLYPVHTSFFGSVQYRNGTAPPVHTCIQSHLELDSKFAPADWRIALRSHCFQDSQITKLPAEVRVLRNCRMRVSGAFICLLPVRLIIMLTIMYV